MGLVLPIVAEDEQGPKHGALGRPVDRPEDPAVEVGGGGEERGDGDEIPGDVAEGAEGVLHPAMRRDRGADVGDLERRRRGGVEFVGGALSDSFEVLALAGVGLSSFSATLGETGTGRNGHFWGRGAGFQFEGME